MGIRTRLLAGLLAVSSCGTLSVSRAAADSDPAEIAKKAAAGVEASRGTLVIHGGGPVLQVHRDRFLEIAGGKSARIVLIPTADPDTPEDDGRLETWRQLGVKHVSMMHARSPEQADEDQLVEPLKTANGVWISGGWQTRLATMYLDTKVDRELQALLRRGGVIGGSSAGAAIMSRVMIVRGQQRVGLDLIPNTVVDQHFLARNRQERLLKILGDNPSCIGIGVDEATAAIVRGNSLEVVGSSQVVLCLPAVGNEPALLKTLDPGGRADLAQFRSQLTTRQRGAAAAR